MSRKNDVSVERSIKEYLMIAEKCFRKCINTTRVQEVTRRQVQCAQHCIALELRQLKKSTANKVPQLKRK